MKVIHLPTTVGGSPQGISLSLCRLGVDSKSWVIQQNSFAYPADKVICNGSDSLCLRELKKLLALRYIFLCNVAFFNFGQGIFKPYSFADRSKYKGLKKVLAKGHDIYSGLLARVEVGLLAFLKKPIFIQYQGDDARQGDYCLKNFDITFATRVSFYTTTSDDAKRKSVAFYAKRATKVYALNPDLLHVLPPSADFLPYSHVDLNVLTPLYTQCEDRPLRLCHAPSNREVKGTDLVIAAVERLKISGYKFEFILVEGVSNFQALEIYKEIDVLVDQLFLGWYGGLAVEAMALGKPVISYIRKKDLSFIPGKMKDELPILQAEPNTVFSVLRNVLELRRSDLLKKAYESRAFVEKWHNPDTIATRIKEDMQFSIRK